MSSVREQILQASVGLIEANSFFGPVGLDDPEPTNFRTSIPGQSPGLGDYVAVQDGPATTTRDGGAVNDFELELEMTWAYAVMSPDRLARRARRDAAMAQFTGIVAANRQLGLPDPQIWAEIKDVVSDDNIAVAAAAPVALLLMTITVQFVASSAAG